MEGVLLLFAMRPFDMGTCARVVHMELFLGFDLANKMSSSQDRGWQGSAAMSHVCVGKINGEKC